MAGNFFKVYAGSVLKHFPHMINYNDDDSWLFPTAQNLDPTSTNGLMYDPYADIYGHSSNVEDTSYDPYADIYGHSSNVEDTSYNPYADIYGHNDSSNVEDTSYNPYADIYGHDDSHASDSNYPITRLYEDSHASDSNSPITRLYEELEPEPVENSADNTAYSNALCYFSDVHHYHHIVRPIYPENYGDGDDGGNPYGNSVSGYDSGGDDYSGSGCNSGGDTCSDSDGDGDCD